MIDYHITMTARCDQCGRVMEKAVLIKPSDVQLKRWEWNREWKKKRVMLVDRKYRRPLIYCQPCADGKPFDK